MTFTIATDTGKWRPSLIAALFAMLPLVILPLLADAGEAPRALLIGIAGLLAATLPFQRGGRPLRIAAAVAAGIFAIMVVSGLANGWSSAVFGVHGRFQGLVSTLLLFLSAGVGAFVFAGRLRTLTDWVTAATVFHAAVVLYQVASGAEPVGLIGNRVPTAAALAVGATLALSAAAFSWGRRRVLFAAAGGVAVLALGVTGSRGAWLGLAAGLGVLGFALLGRMRRSVAAGIAVALVAIVVLGASANAISASKLQLSALMTGSAASRWQIWRGTGEMIADAPLLGVGPGRFLYEFQRYEPVAHARAEGADVRADQAHSLVLQSAAESGVPVALAGVALAGLALWAGYRGIRSGDSAAVIAGAAFAAYCAQGLLGVPTLGVDALGWLLGGVLLARADRLGPSESATAHAARWQVALGVLALAMVALMAWYAVGDYAFARSTTAFGQGRLDEAAAAAEAAIATNPLVDIYRVGLADAASYLGPAAFDPALASLERGLQLEPDSYDLLLARARLLKLSGAGPAHIADAYADAVASYPLGVTVNAEALAAFEAAGRRADAERAAAIVEAAGGAGQVDR